MATAKATTLRLIRGISFADDYENVVLFNTVAEQTEYFLSMNGLGFEEHSYQRVESGYVKLTAQYDAVYRYSYMMFKNTSMQDKWWYAFIDSVEYVNDNTVGVRYHIDVMQSYMFNYTLGESFVVREHSSTDVPGDNLVPENIYYGEYEYDSAGRLEVPAEDCPFSDFFGTALTAEDMCIVVAYNPAILDLTSLAIPDDYLWVENLYGGVYQGLRFICLPYSPKMDASYIETMTANLDKLLGAINTTSFGGIVGVFTMPIIFLPPKDGVSWYNTRRGVSFEPPAYFFGYTPKNKKLLTYPYVAINVTNKRNEGVDYAYEYFINRKPSFNYEGTLSLNPSCICYPVGYKGKTFATEDGVSLDGYPLATWGQDGFTEWVSNHMFQTAIGIGLSAATAGASAYAATAGDLVGATQRALPGVSRADARAIVAASPSTARSTAKSYARDDAINAGMSSLVRNSIGVISHAADTPPAPSGVNAHDLLFGNIYGKQILIRHKRIMAENAKRIDDYFSRYGYATNVMKVPNTKNRPYWNYVKLQDAHLENIDCPMDAVNIVMGVLERGVTFWRPGAVIGDYTNQDNSV